MTAAAEGGPEPDHDVPEIVDRNTESLPMWPEHDVPEIVDRNTESLPADPDHDVPEIVVRDIDTELGGGVVVVVVVVVVGGEPGSAPSLPATGSMFEFPYGKSMSATPCVLENLR